jgi:hypothetical protein
MVGSGGILGCGTQCDRNPNEPPVVYTDGITDRAAGTYFSAEIHGPYLDFPPGRTYRFMHGLGGVPQDVQAWLSFAVGPIDAAKPEAFVQAAGNQVSWGEVTTKYFDVRNDTCSDVRIRVMARDPVFKSAGEADATAPVSSTPSDAGG